MKKNLLVLIGLFVFVGVKAQEYPPNGDFENWSSLNLFEQPEGYNTSNSQVFFEFLKFNASKVTDAANGNFALKLETIASPEDTAFGWAIYGMPGENDNDFSGGFPFKSKADSFKANVKYECANGDSAAMLVIFKRFGQLVGFGLHHLYGTQNTWKEISFPLQVMFAPDTVIIGFASSNFENDYGLNPGNWLMIDDVSFTGTSDTIPNAGFEYWKPFISEEPQGWSSFNLVSLINGSELTVSKSSDAQKGSAALQITTQMLDFGFFELPVGVATTGVLIGEELGGGFAIDEIPDSMTFYYKYDNSKNTNDTAALFIQFMVWDDVNKESVIIDSLFYPILASANYERYTIVFDSSRKAIDSANIVLFSSNLDNINVVGVGNTLLIDNMMMHFYVNSISLDKMLNGALVFPNPATESVNFELNLNQSIDQLTLRIFDLTGKQVMQKNMQGLKTGTQIISHNVSSLESGDYIYLIESKGSRISNGSISIIR